MISKAKKEQRARDPMAPEEPVPLNDGFFYHLIHFPRWPVPQRGCKVHGGFLFLMDQMFFFALEIFVYYKTKTAYNTPRVFTSLSGLKNS